MTDGKFEEQLGPAANTRLRRPTRQGLVFDFGKQPAVVKRAVDQDCHALVLSQRQNGLGATRCVDRIVNLDEIE
ncbi:hypothetical protein D3C76_1406660 [compost metagenome]